ncbi:hypothetical protein [Altibacter sp. HG106]|uniref:hypothetical protein n=1 Tax=Altibacter sp. HG106 TaxID=3023937 RepID=UPI002350D23E|nr:hypothetical protein [Altibacter sp. HG106]MDC7993979.1 hypothetical protein [Altibacter sp. HG106]
MKTFQSILLAGMFMAATVTAFATNPISTTDVIPSETIGELLKNPHFLVTDDEAAFVSFIVNEESEIVVLCVKTENEQLERYVKSRLNYQKVTSDFETGKEYKVPIRLTSKS